MNKDKEIKYSDGDIEQEILASLQNSADVSSGATIALDRQKQVWPFEYHLSRDRANIVRHIDFAGKRVLEIGAGMGAVSRFVAERCDFLQVVEGTSRRLSCLQERLRDLDNYSVYCGNFGFFESEEKFDVVLIIGVLEYADLYYEVAPGQNPFVEFLKKARSFLSADGCLVVAIENRIGMKYWAGATEDHTGGYFDGILGYKSTKTVRTFSKRELLDLFSAAGFRSVKVEYPFPDYKLPRAILTESLEKFAPSLFASMAASSIARDYSQGRSILFSDCLAFDSFSDTGLLGEFANSFLFTGLLKENSPHLDHSKLAYSYSQGRKANVVTVFSRKDGNILVSKSLMDGGAREIKYQGIKWTCPNPVLLINGSLLISQFRRYLTFREWDRFETEWSRYLSWITSNYAVGDFKLQGDAWDLIPQNIIEDAQGNFKAIDQEWSVSELSFSRFVLRCIFGMDSNMCQILKERYQTLTRFYIYSCRLFDIDADEFTLQRDCEIEWKSQFEIYGFVEWGVDDLVNFLNSSEIFYRQEIRKNISQIDGFATQIRILSEANKELESENSKLKIASETLQRIREKWLYKLYVRIKENFRKFTVLRDKVTRYF